MSASGLAFSRVANRVSGSLNGLLFSTNGALSTKAIGSDVQAYNATTTLLGNTTTGSGSIVLASSPTLVTPTIASLIGNKIYPASDGTAAIQFNKADGTTNVVTIDTTNAWVGFGAAPICRLDLGSYSTTNAQIKVGSLHFQGYANNNCGLTDNLYYNTEWKYRDAGYGSAISFINGAIYLRTAPSGTAGTAATVTDRVTITNAGYVGIGCTPSYIFDVQTSKGKFSVTDYGTVSVKLLSSAAMAYDSNGNHSFICNGSIVAAIYSQSEQFRLLYDTTYYTRFVQSTTGLTLSPSVNSSTAFNLCKADGSTYVARFDTTGGRLTLGSVANQGGVFQAYNATNAQFYSIGGTPGMQMWIDSTQTKASRFFTDTNGDLKLGVYNGTAWNNTFLLQNSTGNVGIGTSAPNALLDVGGAFTSPPTVLSAMVPTVYCSINGAGIRGIVMGNASTTATADYRFIIRDNLDSYIAFDYAGSNCTTTALFGLAGNTWGGIFTSGSDTDARHLLLGTATEKSIIFGTYNSERMRISSNGDVGIGLISPNAKVEILSTATQLRLSYSASYYTNFVTSNAGNLTISPSGGTVNISGILAASGKIQGTYLNVSSTTTPGSPASGDVYFNGTHFYGYNGSTWLQLDNAA